jgi:hypothetical protein
MFATNSLAAPAQRLRATFCARSGQTVLVGIVAVGRQGAAFRQWIDALPRESYTALVRLRWDGFAYDLVELEMQLLQALQAEPVGPLTQIVGQRLLELLAAHHDAACFFLEEEE